MHFDAFIPSNKIYEAAREECSKKSYGGWKDCLATLENIICFFSSNLKYLLQKPKRHVFGMIFFQE